MAKLIEPRSIPLTSPVTVAHFCRPRMCSMSVNGYASTKVRYREITAERRTMTTLQMVRREASCACCRGFLDGKLNRRHFVRAVAIGAATFGLVPHIALAAEGNYEAMILSCIDPRMQEPVHKYTVEQNLTGKFSQFVIAGAAIGVVAPAFKEWHKAFWDNLGTSIQLHHIKKVIAIDHRDCGAARIAYGEAKVANPQVETDTHKAALAEFRKQAGERHPQLGVETGLMALDGKLEMFS
jgi:carbonic anhydrase